MARIEKDPNEYLGQAPGPFEVHGDENPVEDSGDKFHPIEDQRQEVKDAQEQLLQREEEHATAVLDESTVLPDGNGGDPVGGLEQVKPLSKNAQKRLLKMERYMAYKVERKAIEKERRHQETERKRKEWEDKLASLPAEEHQKFLQSKIENRKARKEKSFNKKEKLRQAMETGQNLVLDLEFCDRMKSNEVVSLVQQVMYSYAANAKATLPVRLSLTGCKGEILDRLGKVSGFSSWLLHKEERSYMEVFQERKSDLVYLTADSEHAIDCLDESKIYIVGGLVDRNRWKGLTYDKAKTQGILSAKLPISEHLKMASSSVLTVNQVVEIILAFLESKDWAKALSHVIPQRKRAAESELDCGDKDSNRGDLQADVGEDGARVEFPCDI